MAEIDNLIAEVNKKYKTDIIRKAFPESDRRCQPCLI